jgi:hypothetical protein
MDFVKIPLTKEQHEKLLKIAGSQAASRLISDATYDESAHQWIHPLPMGSFRKLVTMQAKGETMGATLLSAAEAGVIDFGRKIQ